jgi:hypothetical protein
MNFFIHDGYCGWAYGCPSDPCLISPEDAHKLMALAGLTMSQVAEDIPPAQYAQTGDDLFRITGGNRFLRYGTLENCADVKPERVNEPFTIIWF